MGIPLQRFDMSEYMERHSVSRLIGAPPGYVGYDQGGLLTDAVDQHPHSVLLLDEIEKAHPDLFNILLQVMDNGKLTDHHGKTVDFRNTILIMTTNAGAADMARESIGFGAATREDAQEDAVKKMFTPEFRNRLDAIVPFAYLPPAVVARVVDKFILQLELQLADRNVHIDLDDEARQWLTDRGYDKMYGARPMGRLVQEKIKQPLAEELLFGKLVNGGEVKVRIKDNAPAFEITPARAQGVQKERSAAQEERRPARQGGVNETLLRCMGWCGSAGPCIIRRICSEDVPLDRRQCARARLPSRRRRRTRPPSTPARLSQHIQILSSDAYRRPRPRDAAARPRRSNTSPSSSRPPASSRAAMWSTASGSGRRRVPLLKSDHRRRRRRSASGPPRRNDATDPGRADCGARADQRRSKQVALNNVPLLFAGYGVTAPERQWDDFKDVDVRGKMHRRPDQRPRLRRRRRRFRRQGDDLLRPLDLQI